MKLISKVFIILNLLIPLFLGLFIYLTSRDRTVLFDMFSFVGIRLQFSLIMELIQIPRSMPGTFDFIDIVTEFCAIGLAVFIAINYGRFIHEKNNC